MINGVKVKDHPGLVRVGAAIVNCNVSEYELAIKRIAQQQKFLGMESRIETLESKLDEILNLLRNK